jgi:hypothetical protein
MEIINSETEMVPLKKLIRHPRNPRQGDIGAIYQSIEANGFYGAIVAQKSTGHVLAGNHRLEAAKQAGAEVLPVIWVDVDDTTALRILLADNRTNDLASYDDRALAELLQSLMEDTGSTEGSGYDGDDLDDLLSKFDHINFDPGTADEQGKLDQLEPKWIPCPHCGKEFNLRDQA